VRETVTVNTCARLSDGYLPMKKLDASEARASLSRLLDEAAETHKPVETLYLLSIPGMRESIRAGMKTPAKKLAKDLCW
jgi:antitoxin YefM